MKCFNLLFLRLIAQSLFSLFGYFFLFVLFVIPFFASLIFLKINHPKPPSLFLGEIDSDIKVHLIKLLNLSVFLHFDILVL